MGSFRFNKKSQAGEMPCQLITFSFDKKDVLALIFNRHSSVTDIENINGGELVRKLKSEKSRFEDIKRMNIVLLYIPKMKQMPF